MRLLQTSWMKGSVAGLVVAVVLLTVAHRGIAPGTFLSKPFEYVTSIPPFLLSAVQYLSDPGVTVLYLIWWPALGGVLGWSLSRGRSGRILSAIAIVALVVLHVLARDAIVREFSRADQHMNGLARVEGGQLGRG